MSTGTLKMLRYSSHSCIADTVEVAINNLYGEGRRAVLFSSQPNKLRKMCDEIYKEITKRNKDIPNVEDQMLPTFPYWWDDIDGCLAVKCVEISMDVFAKSAECFHVFTQPNYSVLTDPTARRPLSFKAFTSLAMMGHMLSRQDES